MINRITMLPPEWNRGEILRYARADKNDLAVMQLVDECIKEAEPTLSYRAVYTVSDIVRKDGRLSFGGIVTESDTVRKALENCEMALLFAATIGTPFDRLIAKYSRLEPSKALILQAIGAERIESLCDALCDFLSTSATDGCRLKTRVSPGYGDIPLAMQRDIFAVLDCPRKIGLTLSEELLMSPSKSVTAIAGFCSGLQDNSKLSCGVCQKSDCQFRR